MMAHRPVRIVLALLVFLLAACSTPKPQPFTSTAGKFTVTSPVDLKESTQPVDTKAGQVDAHMFLGDAGVKSYLVVFTVFDPSVRNADPMVMLGGARDGIVKNISGSLVNDIEVDLNGNPGREFEVSGQTSNQDVVLKARIFLAQARLYEVMALADKANVDQNEMQAFLLSFKILP